MAGGVDCAESPGVSVGSDEVRTKFGVHFAIIRLATSPLDCQAMAATPMHPASSKAAKARTARLPIDRPGTRTFSTAAGRNVVSTGGIDGPAATSDPLCCGSERWRAAL